jgi:hypothetical protein
VTKDQEVESDDLQRIAIAGMQHSYAKLRLSKGAFVPAGEREASHLDDPLTGQLRGYLYSKYVEVEATSDAAGTK